MKKRIDLKLENVLGLFVSFREGINFDGKGHAASAEHINHSIVIKSDFKSEFLQTASESPGGLFGGHFAGGAGARDFARRPNARCCVGSSQFHRNHAILFAILHIRAIQRNFTQIQMAPHTETAHYIVYNYVYFGLLFGRHLLRYRWLLLQVESVVERVLRAVMVLLHKAPISAIGQRLCRQSVLLNSGCRCHNIHAHSYKQRKIPAKSISTDFN